MLQNIFLWIAEHIFKIKTQATNREIRDNDTYSKEYKRIDQINFTAIFSNKIANYIANDSSIDVNGDSERAKYFNELAHSIKRKLKKISSMVLGTGGVAIVPYVKNKQIYYNLVLQDRITIDNKAGDLITGATILAESKVISDLISQKIYYRWTNYQIVNNDLIIQQKFTDENGVELPDIPEFWADIPTTTTISNVDRVPLGFIISPANSRRIKDDYGVPITYGCDSTIEEIRECLKQIAREFKAKETFIGVDYTLFKKDKNGGLELPNDGLYRKFNSDKDDFWEVFSPDIRESSYYARLQELYSRLEKEVGTSAGILTEIKTAEATATAIRKSLYDTFTIVDDLRDNIEKGLEDFFKACEVLANAYGVVTAGEYELSYDWDCSLFEDTQTTFSQYTAGVSEGVVSKAELRRFIFSNESLEDSKKAVEEIAKENDEIGNLLNDEDEEDTQDNSKKKKEEVNDEEDSNK